MPIRQETWQQGLDSQSACNLSGLAHFLPNLLDELRGNGVNCTAALNTHPLVRLIVAQWHTWHLAALTAEPATSGNVPINWPKWRRAAVLMPTGCLSQGKRNGFWLRGKKKTGRMKGKFPVPRNTNQPTSIMRGSMFAVKSKFSLGQVVATPGALEAMTESGQTADFFLNRHVSGDWGIVDAEDCQANDQALVEGTRLLSAYSTLKGVKLWVLTEHDRSVTTILLPSDY